MANAFDVYNAKRAKRINNRRNARRLASLARTAGDGLALLATIALIAALYLLAHGVAQGSMVDCTGLPTQAHVDRCVANANGASYAGATQPCAFEDSANCYWDAKARGNGLGQSFIDVGGKRYAIGAGAYDLVHVDAQGNAWVMDYEQTLGDCLAAKRATSLPTSCELSEVGMP